MYKIYFIIFFSFMCITNAFAASCNNITPTTQISMGSNISIPRSVAVGTEIARAKSSAVTTYSCVNDSPFFTYQAFGIKGYGTYAQQLDSKRIYKTNIPGIGYAVYGTSITACSGTSGYVTGQNNVDGNENNSWLCAVDGIFKTQPIQGSMEIIFYKIADVTGSGQISVGKAAAFILQNNKTSWVYPESTVNLSPFTIYTDACDLKTNPINVNMGKVEKNQFNGIGTNPFESNTKSFQINLVCDPNVKINLQLDGSIQNASRGVINILNPSASTSAKGVGIQLLYKNSPVVLGTPIFIGQVDNTANSLYNIDLKARYYQIADKISPGTANGTATFRITYQ